MPNLPRNVWEVSVFFKICLTSQRLRLSDDFNVSSITEPANVPRDGHILQFNET